MRRTHRRRDTTSRKLAERYATIGDTPTRIVLMSVYKQDQLFETVGLEVATSIALDQLHEYFDERYGEDATLDFADSDMSPEETPAALRTGFTIILERSIEWHTF
jgi:hypothetical protein